MTSELTKWRIWCNDENGWQERWSETAITVCPNDNTHNVKSDSVQETDKISRNLVQIREEFTPQGYTPTSQKFKIESIVINAAANTTTTYTISWPFPIVSLKVFCTTGEEHRGDELTLTVAPDTIIGAITQNVEIGDTIINVQSTVTANLLVGYYVDLTDFVTFETKCRVIAIDSIAGTITLETATTNAFSALSPTYVRMTVYNIKDMELSEPAIYQIGDKHIGGAYIPANSNVVCYYKNKHLTDAKKFVGYVEYYY